MHRYFADTGVGRHWASRIIPEPFFGVAILPPACRPPTSSPSCRYSRSRLPDCVTGQHVIGSATPISRSGASCTSPTCVRRLSAMKGHRKTRKGNEAPRRSKASTGNGRLLQGNCQAWQPGRRFQATDQESWYGQAVTNRQPPIRKRLVDVRPDPNLLDGRPRSLAASAGACPAEAAIAAFDCAPGRPNTPVGYRCRQAFGYVQPAKCRDILSAASQLSSGPSKVSIRRPGKFLSY